MATLYVFGGLIGSGFQNEAKDFAESMELPLIDANLIRKEMQENDPDLKNNILFEEIHRRMKRQLNTNQDLVFTATNLIKRQRKDLVTKMKPHQVKMTYVIRSIDNCIIEDAKEEHSQGEDVVIQKFMTAEIPFDEGFSDIFYNVEPVSTDTVSHYLSEYEKIKEKYEDDAIRWANVFVRAGKPLLETRGEEGKKYGYNNMSAQIAFQVLYTMNYHVEFIQEVMQLILYKKRILNVSGTGRETLKNQIGEELFQKLQLMTES